MQRFLRSILFLLVVSIVLAVGVLVAQAQQPNAAPINADATPAARRLLLEIDSLSGRATLSGQHNFPNSVSRYSDRVYDLTGKYPALFGQDLGFASDPERELAHGRAELIKEVTRQYRAGAVIALTWHAVRPTDEEPVTFHGSVQAHLTDWEWKQLLTPGTDLYNRWCRQVDLVAGYLRELQDAGVPVLFRPYHEMNGNWFWWGGRPGPNGSSALYRQLYERYVHLHHLNNLIWVWNVNSPNQNAGPISEYYPGPGYADVVSMDIYSTFEQSYYDSMVSLAGPTRPIALAEVGKMPTLAELARQPRWTYFMVWSSFEESANTPEQLAAVYNAPNIADRGDPRLPAPTPEPTAPPFPVAQDADLSARNLLVRLYAMSPQTTLRGQQVVFSAASSAPAARSVPASQNQDQAVAEKLPSLVEFTMAEPDETQVLPAIRKATKAGQIVILRWTPPRPSDAAPAGVLTDYEWQQLTTPGTDMNARWVIQVDQLAKVLKQLEAEHIAVLWSPYPSANAEGYWWSGRPGAAGSAALTRLLAERLTNQERVHNLVWVWEAAAPGFLPGSVGALQDYFPGPLYADAFTLDVHALRAGRSSPARMLESFAATKPIGVHVATELSAPIDVDEKAAWKWIVLPVDKATSAAAEQ